MNIRRYYVPNAIVFITQVVDRRIPIFTRSAYIDLLIANLRKTEKHHPYDFERHLDYIHYNPAGHGLVKRSEEWPHSSFHSWKQKGVYPDRWGWTAPLSSIGDEWQMAEADYD